MLNVELNLKNYTLTYQNGYLNCTKKYLICRLQFHGQFFTLLICSNKMSDFLALSFQFHCIILALKNRERVEV